jgi:hypothetical protein
MYYYYDVLINLENKNDLYEFYEWVETDNIEFIKKIPLYRVSLATLKDLMEYRVKFSSDLLEEIKDKTILKNANNTILYAFIVSDTKNALALILNGDGNVICRSKLLLSDEINLNEIMYTMEEVNLSYTKKDKYKNRNCLRQVAKIKELIKKEIDTLYENNNISKLKYLYFEWFNKQNNDIENIYKEMNNSLKDNYSENEERIYELIKQTYNKVI